MYLWRFLDFLSRPQGPQNDPKLTPKTKKLAKISNFLRFNAVFVKFLIESVDWNVENFQHDTNLLCSIGFTEKIIAVFHMKKNQNDTENGKNL